MLPDLQSCRSLRLYCINGDTPEGQVVLEHAKTLVLEFPTITHFMVSDISFCMPKEGNLLQIMGSVRNVEYASFRNIHMLNEACKPVMYLGKHCIPYIWVESLIGYHAENSKLQSLSICNNMLPYGSLMSFAKLLCRLPMLRCLIFQENISSTKEYGCNLGPYVMTALTLAMRADPHRVTGLKALEMLHMDTSQVLIGRRVGLSLSDSWSTFPSELAVVQLQGNGHDDEEEFDWVGAHIGVDLGCMTAQAMPMLSKVQFRCWPGVMPCVSLKHMVSLCICFLLFCCFLYDPNSLFGASGQADCKMQAE